MGIEKTIGMTIGSVIFGGFITFLCSRYYYEKASMELKKEAEKLKHLNNLVLNGMENANFMTLARDAQGNPTALIFKVNVHGTLHTISSTSPVLTQTKKEEDKKGGETE